MADIKPKIPLPSIPLKSKRQTKGGATEDPFANARVRAILDPEQADLLASKLEEIQSSGATISIGNAAEDTIERLVSVTGSPDVVGKVFYYVLDLC